MCVYRVTLGSPRVTLFIMSPTEQIRALLGEHFKNYVVIMQDYDKPCSFDMYESDPFAAIGLSQEAQKFEQAKVNQACEVTYEWVDWDLEDDADEEDLPDI